MTESDLSRPEPPGRVAIIAGPLSSAEKRMIERLATAPGISVEAIKKWDIRRLPSGAFRFSDAQRDALRRLNVTLILNLLDRPMDDPLRDELPYGVWWFHRHPAADGLTPIGVDEVMSGTNHIGLVLCRDRGDGGSSLQQGVVRAIPWSTAETRRQVWEATVEWPRQAWLRGGHPLGSATGEHGHERARRPSWLRLRALSLLRRLRHLAQRALEREKWAIGIVRAPPAQVALHFDPSQVEWLPEVDGGFLADPFPVERSNGLTILAEYFDWRSRQGHIAAVDFDEEHGASEPRTIFAPPYHVSYPMPVADGGDGSLMIIPETIATDTVTLFKGSTDADDWTPVETLIANRRLADATLLEYGGRHWLFALDVDHGDECALVIWHAPTKRGPWEPHAGNPVKVDVGGARPAGPFIEHEGRLLRPGQDSAQTYGGRIIVHEVKELSIAAFREEPVATIEPDPAGPYPRGIHTIAGVGSLTVVDGKRSGRVSPITAARRVIDKLVRRR